MNAYQKIYVETRKLVHENCQLRDFAGCLPVDPDFAKFAAQSLPHLPQLDGVLHASSAQTHPLTALILNYRFELHWQQSYGEDELGAHYLQNYGWFNLLSPEGPIIFDQLRISFGYWGHGLEYPRHWHEPEEIYYVLAGGAEFYAEGEEMAYLACGGTRKHISNQPHSMRMTKAPLFAMAIWRGKNLNRKAELGA